MINCIMQILQLLQRIKAYVLDQNIFLPLQLFFAWSLFKILGFLHVSFLNRIFISFVVLIVIICLFKDVMKIVLNSMFFQMFLFFSFKFFEYFIKKGTMLFWVTFIISLNMCFCFSDCWTFSLGSIVFQVPIIGKNLMIVFLISFSCRIVDLVFYKTIEWGCDFVPESNTELGWSDFVELLNLHFYRSIKIENKLVTKFYKSLTFSGYPFSTNTLAELKKPENFICYGLLDCLEKRRLWTDDDKVSFSKALMERLNRLGLCILKDRLENNIIFFLVFYGNLFGVFISTVFLNLFNGISLS